MDVSDTRTNATCATHGAYLSQTIEIMGRRFNRGCQACIVESERRQAESDRRQADHSKRMRIESMFKRSGIPMRFQARNFANYEAKGEGQERALRISESYASQFDEMRNRGTCMIFSGRAGTGKTHLGCAIANQVMASGSSALFTTVTDAMRLIKQSYSKESDTNEGDAIQTLVAPALLVLDEVGADFGTEHSKTLLFDLLNKRYENLLCTIILTNLDAVALREYMGDRVMDRLREGGGKMVSFAWDSHRA